MKPKLGGWRPSPRDARDLTLTPALGSFPLVEGLRIDNGVDMRLSYPPVEDQHDIGACTANAVVGELEALRTRAGLVHRDLSRLFPYYNARALHGEQNRDEGTYIRSLMKTVRDLGVCWETTWPYDVSTVTTRPSWSAYREAYARKISSYISIPGEGSGPKDAIVRTLDAGHGVIFGCTIDDDFIATSTSGFVAMPKSRRVNPGGHAMLIVGYFMYDGILRFIVRNSWGTSWAAAGYCTMPVDYLDASEASDYWTILLPPIDIPPTSRFVT